LDDANEEEHAEDLSTLLETVGQEEKQRERQVLEITVGSAAQKGTIYA